jgi:CHAT domain-containing protein
VDQLQDERDRILAALSQFEAELAQTHGPAAGQVYDLPRLQARLPADVALLSWIDRRGRPQAADPNGEHWACIVRRRGDPLWVKLSGSGPKGAWTPDDDRLPGRVRDLLTQAPADVAVRWREPAGQLYAQRLAPLAPHLAATKDLPAVRRLIILPAPAQAGVPVEALIDARTDRQPAYVVSYAPSGTLFAWLQEKKPAAPGHGPKATPPRLLALGDPVFAPAEAVGPPAPPEHAPKARPRGSAFEPLPGSRREVEAIARLFDQPVLLLGTEASEQRLDQLRLRDYAYLHLATHGVLDPQHALDSALILSQDALPDQLAQVLAAKKAYDGRLTAGQILHTWKLDARLVTLSACQSGLGPYRGGEGYVGFAQALLLAGSRGVVLSQWQVDDNATALLMTRFYQNLLGKRPGLEKPLAKAEALTEAKAWLRGLKEDEVEQYLAELPRGTPRARPTTRPAGAVHPYGHPYYWAAFILIGDPN